MRGAAGRGRASCLQALESTWPATTTPCSTRSCSTCWSPLGIASRFSPRATAPPSPAAPLRALVEDMSSVKFAVGGRRTAMVRDGGRLALSPPRPFLATTLPTISRRSHTGRLALVSPSCVIGDVPLLRPGAASPLSPRSSSTRWLPQEGAAWPSSRATALPRPATACDCGLSRPGSLFGGGLQQPGFPSRRRAAAARLPLGRRAVERGTLFGGGPTRPAASHRSAHHAVAARGDRGVQTLRLPCAPMHGP